MRSISQESSNKVEGEENKIAYRISKFRLNYYEKGLLKGYKRSFFFFLRLKDDF